MSSLSLLDVAVEERKEELGEKAVTFVFKKEDHAKILLDNLRDMQAGNEGILTDVNLISRRKDSEEKFHSMLLAASSPNVKDLLMARSVKDSARAILLDGLTKETLRCLRKFIYKCEFTIDEDTLQDLHNFAVQFEIDALAAKCEELQDHQGRIKVVPDDHGDVLLELLNMFFEKELTTTTIEDYQGKIQLAVHGPLVAAVSPALQDIILQGCTSQGRHPIRLGIHANVLRDFIGYLYSAKVTLQRENAVGLLRAACTYQIPALSQVCCEWLIAKLDTYDVVGILCLVRELDSEHTAELERRTKKIIITNFSSLSAEHGINALGHEDLMEIIQDEDLEIEDEEHVLHVVMKWLEFDEKNRLPHLSRLLACVRLEQTSLDFLDTIQQDPRIGRSPECLEVIEEARHRLADQGHSMSHSSSHDDEGFQGSEESYDGDSWHEDPREELEGLPTASYNGEDFEDSNLRESDHIDDCYSCYTGDSYNSSPREDEHDDSYLRDRYDSSPPDSYSHGYSDDEEASCLSGPKRKDGQPDMRFKVNRRIFCKSGKNKDDSRDLRLREHRREFPGPVKKNGEPDMRYKVNKELFGALRKTSASISTNVPAKVHPVKKDGTRDMRYRNNRTALCGSSYVSSSACSVATGTLTGGTKSSLGPSLAKVYTEGPLKKNGAPDMRYAVNKQRFGNLPAATTSSRGPLKKDGKPDMRYAANRQSHHPPQSRSQAQGPLKKDGTPDMRYKANRR